METVQLWGPVLYCMSAAMMQEYCILRCLMMISIVQVMVVMMVINVMVLVKISARLQYSVVFC